MATATKRVRKGTKFYSSYADGRPQWKVLKNRGPGVWEAVAINSPDWDGVTQVFTTEEILGSIAQDAGFSALMADHGSYYASLTPGQILHYDHGFGEEFVRAEVVVEDGKHKLKQIALVGKWHRIYRRDLTGKVYWEHSAKQVLEGAIFEPNYGSIYESPRYKGRRAIDPRGLDPIPLEAPELSPEEAKEAELWKAVKKLQEILGRHKDRPGALLIEVNDEVSHMVKTLLAD